MLSRARASALSLTSRSATGTSSRRRATVPVTVPETVPVTVPVRCELAGERDRLVEELGRLEQAVGEAELECLRPAQHPVLPHRVLDDERDRGLDADEARDELRAA